MTLICELTDQSILGLDGYSTAQPRLTARAVLRNTEDLYAVLHSAKNDFYYLPGGGIEGDEDPMVALRREVLEETGCSCDEISELGRIDENRAHCDYTQKSFYYIVTTCGQVSEPQYTELELDNQTRVLWRPLQEVVRLISTPVYETNQQKFLQARDVAALREYMCRSQG